MVSVLGQRVGVPAAEWGRGDGIFWGTIVQSGVDTSGGECLGVEMDAGRIFHWPKAMVVSWIEACTQEPSLKRQKLGAPESHPEGDGFGHGDDSVATTAGEQRRSRPNRGQHRRLQDGAFDYTSADDGSNHSGSGSEAEGERYQMQTGQQQQAAGRGGGVMALGSTRGQGTRPLPPASLALGHDSYITGHGGSPGSSGGAVLLKRCTARRRSLSASPPGGAFAGGSPPPPLSGGGRGAGFSPVPFKERSEGCMPGRTDVLISGKAAMAAQGELVVAGRGVSARSNFDSTGKADGGSVADSLQRMQQHRSGAASSSRATATAISCAGGDARDSPSPNGDVVAAAVVGLIRLGADGAVGSGRLAAAALATFGGGGLPPRAPAHTHGSSLQQHQQQQHQQLSRKQPLAPIQLHPAANGPQAVKPPIPDASGCGVAKTWPAVMGVPPAKGLTAFCGVPAWDAAAGAEAMAEVPRNGAEAAAAGIPLGRAVY